MKKILNFSFYFVAGFILFSFINFGIFSFNGNRSGLNLLNIQNNNLFTATRIDTKPVNEINPVRYKNWITVEFPSKNK